MKKFLAAALLFLQILPSAYASFIPGATKTDESAFTEGSDSVSVTGGVYNDSPSSDPTSGQATFARITQKRAFHANLRNASGTEIGTASNPVRTDPTGTTTQPVSAISWPLPTGAATAANQSTANTSLASIDSKTPALGQALAAGSVPVVLTAAQVTTLTPPTTVTANIGTTGGLALDSTVSGLQVNQSSTTSGQKGSLVMGAVSTSAPSYTNAQTSPVSLTPAGAVRTDSSATTQPISGTVTANAGSGTFTVSGTVTANQGGAPWQMQSNSANISTESTLSTLNGKVATAITADYDTGAGTQTMQMLGIALPGSGGAVAGGTATAPVRTDPTGTTTQPVSASSLPLPSNAAQETGGNLATIAGAVSSSKMATKSADGDFVTLGAKTDARSTATDTTSVSAMQVFKEISFMLQNPASVAVTNAGTFAVQAAITAASGSIASGAIASGAIASGAMAAGSISSGAAVSGAFADGALVTLGAKADARSTATDTTAVTAMQVLKEISFMLQNPAALASGTNTIGSVKWTDGTSTAVVDPCQANAKSYVNINISSATTTRIIAPTSSKKNIICSLVILTNAANNVVLEEGTGGTCGTGTAGMSGDTTTGWPLAANGGLTFGNGLGAVFQTAGTNVDTCIKTSAATQLSGTASYVQQ